MKTPNTSYRPLDFMLVVTQKHLNLPLGRFQSWSVFLWRMCGARERAKGGNDPLPASIFPMELCHWQLTLCMLMLDWLRFTVGGVAGTRKPPPFSLSVSEVGRSGYIRGERGGALGALSDSNSDTCDSSSCCGGLVKASSTSSVCMNSLLSHNEFILSTLQAWPFFTIHWFKLIAAFQGSLPPLSSILYCLEWWQDGCDTYRVKFSLPALPTALTTYGSRAGHLPEVSLGRTSPVLVWRGLFELFLQTRNFVQLPFRAQGGLATLGVREKVFSWFLLCVCMLW